jgi:hypothetical protein
VAQLTFPKAQDSDSVRVQGSLDVSVALFVAGQLASPIWAIRLGYVAALRAAVPETAVDEHGDPLSREKEIRTSKHGLGPKLPVRNTISDQVPAEARFRCCVGMRFDCPHIL